MHDWDKGETEHNCWRDVLAEPKRVINELVRKHTFDIVLGWAHASASAIVKEEKDRVAAADKAKRDALLARIEDGRVAQRQLDRLNGKDV